MVLCNPFLKLLLSTANFKRPDIAVLLFQMASSGLLPARMAAFIQPSSQNRGNSWMPLSVPCQDTYRDQGLLFGNLTQWEQVLSPMIGTHPLLNAASRE